LCSWDEKAPYISAGGGIGGRLNEIYVFLTVCAYSTEITVAICCLPAYFG
jgi:hypothetical protein